MTENSTNDKPKSTPTTTRSKASSTEAEAAADTPEVEKQGQPDINSQFPGFLRKLRGFDGALEAIETARREQRLPSLNPTDYRVIPKRPGGIPFSFPVQIIYRPDSPQEKDLGTFRIGR